MANDLTSKIKSGIEVVAPGMTCGQKWLLGLAGCFKWGWFISRKVRILRKKENLVPFAIGSAINGIAQSSPTLQAVARFTLGTVSIIRCAEDLAEISRLARLAWRCFKGKEYVVVKKDSFAVPANEGVSPSIQDKTRWKLVVYKAQIKLMFKTIGEIFKRFFLLVMHLGDIYTAFEDNTASEVVIHSRDLWNKLTSSNSRLVKYLERSQKINDWMLEKMGSTKKTAILVKLLSVPAKIRRIAPDYRDVKNIAVTAIKDQFSYIQADIEFQFVRDYEALGGDPSHLYGQKYWIYEKGSKKDPHTHRFIKPPRINVKLLEG